MDSTPFENNFGINIPFKEHKYIIVYIKYNDLYNILKFLNIPIILKKKSYFLLDIGIDSKNDKTPKISNITLSSLKTIMNISILHSIIKSNFKTRNIINLQLVDNKVIFYSDIYMSPKYKLLILNSVLQQFSDTEYNDIIIKTLL